MAINKFLCISMRRSLAMKNDELKACPFCGIRNGEWLVYSDVQNFIQCKSLTCMAQTGIYPTKSMAIKAWNTRTEPKEQDVCPEFLTKKFLLRDIEHLSNHDISKLYKYIRRYLIAEIDGLVDPLEPTKGKDVCSQCGGDRFFDIFFDGIMNDENVCKACNGTGKAPADKIREAFKKVYGIGQENYTVNHGYDDHDVNAIYIRFKAGYQAGYESQQAEIERLKIINEAQFHTINVLIQENKAMRKDIEAIGNSLFTDCCGGSDHYEAWKLIDNWQPKEKI